MQEFEIVLEDQPQCGAVFTCRAMSVVAALKRAAAILPENQNIEIRSDERCVYRGTIQPNIPLGGLGGH